MASKARFDLSRFFRCGYVKDFVISWEIKSLSDTKEKLNDAIERISIETLEKV